MSKEYRIIVVVRELQKPYTNVIKYEFKRETEYWYKIPTFIRDIASEAEKRLNEDE